MIIADNNSTDRTKEIVLSFCHSHESGLPAGEAGNLVQVFNRGPERLAQRNFGVKHACGDYILIIDSDMKLSKNIVASCVKKIKSDGKIKAIVILEESFRISFRDVFFKRISRITIFDN